MEKVKSLGVMLDCSRDAVYTVEALKKYLSSILTISPLGTFVKTIPSFKGKADLKIVSSLSVLG